MALSVPIDPREITITPIFKHMTVEDVPASERAGHPIMKTIEMVEVRFAGSKNYSPVFPTDAFWQRDGHRVVTYAERWSEQYRSFKEGRAQEAAGTPLEMLRPYGITDAQLSLCRALKVYSIEALHHLEGPTVKSLGMSANDLKDISSRYMADRASGGAAHREMEAMRAEIEELRRRVPPDEKAELAKVDDLTAAADEDALKSAIKAEIEQITGTRPRGNPSLVTLEQMLAELKQG